MTVIDTGTAIISCDDEIHIGLTTFRVAVGTRVTVEAGIRARGWGVSGRGTVHQCPKCRGRRLEVNN